MAEVKAGKIRVEIQLTPPFDPDNYDELFRFWNDVMDQINDIEGASVKILRPLESVETEDDLEEVPEEECPYDCDVCRE